MDLGIANVAAITMIAYFVGIIIKSSKLDNKWIPISCGLTGLILGIVAYFIKMPDMPASDPITAAAIGIASGLAATGINQVFKEFKEDNNENIE